MLTDGTVRGFLAALAAPRATPGGGSACALASAAGASLLMMVAALAKTGSALDVDRTSLAATVLALTGLQQQLTEAIHADASAYGQVAAAFKLPRSSQAEVNARDAAVKRALRGATDVPLDIMRLSADALKHAPLVANRASRPATSDVAVAIGLLRAGLEGAFTTVASNLAGLADETFVSAVRAEIERLRIDGAEAATRAQRALAV